MAASCQGTHQRVLEACEVWKGLQEERPTPALEDVFSMGPADPKTEEKGEEEMKIKAKKRKRRRGKKVFKCLETPTVCPGILIP